MPTTKTRWIADRYNLLRPLGRGGMGVVWLAEDTLLKRQVAIKEIEFPPGLEPGANDAVKARAVREARSAARLSHRGIVTIFDVIQVEQGAYIVMEYVDSPTLSDHVKEDGPESPQRTARIGLQVLAALEVAHAGGVVHRDVKPGNILMGPDHVKLADFGIASVKDDPKITSTGMVLGSPQFMAPEQATGSGSDARTDLWALGATLYYAVEGTLPFDRGRPIPTLAAVMNDQPRPMQRAGELEPVIHRLLAKDPGDRPSGPEAKAMLEGVGVTPVGTSPVGAPDTDRTDEVLAVDVGRRVRPSQGKRPLALISALAVAALLVAAIAIALGLRDSPAPDRAGGSGRDRDSGNGSEQQNTQGGQGSNEVPSGWTTYTDGATGYTLQHPPAWEVSPVDDSMTDFEDPASGTYLRVDWTGEPGPSPVGAWQQLARSFAQGHSGYSEIRIEPTSYKGFKAAVWEFTYEEGRASLHATDLGFVTDDYGFALYFQTRAEDWESSQPLFERLRESFVVPG